jgi:hypothetical protein
MKFLHDVYSLVLQSQVASAQVAQQTRYLTVH